MADDITKPRAVLILVKFDGNLRNFMETGKFCGLAQNFAVLGKLWPLTITHHLGYASSHQLKLNPSHDTSLALDNIRIKLLKSFTCRWNVVSTNYCTISTALMSSMLTRRIQVQLNSLLFSVKSVSVKSEKPTYYLHVSQYMLKWGVGQISSTSPFHRKKLQTFSDMLIFCSHENMNDFEVVYWAACAGASN